MKTNGKLFLHTINVMRRTNDAAQEICVMALLADNPDGLSAEEIFGAIESAKAVEEAKAEALR